MNKKYLILIPLLTQTIYPKNIIDCRVMVGDSINECNPYGSKLFRAKEITYNVDRKKLIRVKTLPKPKPQHIKIISVADMMEKYIEVQEPVRYISTPKTYAKKLKPEKYTSYRIMSDNEDFSDLEKLEDKNKVGTKFIKYTPSTKKVYHIYTVQRGDVLSKIAKKFTMRTKDIKKINKIGRRYTLKIGQKLKLPFEQDIINAISTGEYQIKKGDTFISIARKFKLNPRQLIRYNSSKNDSLIHKNKLIRLPLPYILKSEAKQKKILERQRRILEGRKHKIRVIKGFGTHRLRVTATAYSSHRRQTDRTPFLAAWNNRLRPGMKIIAVSRDLLTKYGMRNGTKVHIGGLSGYYRVRDKMNKRYRKRIDIYTGVNRKRALRWGRRSVVISW
jgi:LysM repeat protein/3D (Asp-Asp-Asp) domain-containing protein